MEYFKNWILIVIILGAGSGYMTVLVVEYLTGEYHSWIMAPFLIGAYLLNARIEMRRRKREEDQNQSD